MTKAKRGLGRGLGAFFGEETVEEVVKERRAEHSLSESAPAVENTDKENTAINKNKTSGSSVKTAKAEKTEEQKEITVKLSKIEPNRDQPRKDFNEEQLQELADSIKKYGVLQPLLVQKKESGFEIVAGERRWRAAKLAGLKEVPVVIREYSPQQAMEIALIENVQREDLNPIEEALAYQRLMQEFQLKQEEIAERVSKNRSTITNSMRLLNLTPEVRQMLVENRITSGHARALLGVEDPKLQLELAQKIEQNRLSVREVEKAVKLLGKEKKEKKKKPNDEALELIFRDLEERMKTAMGTKVNISRKDKNKGRIEIEYYSESELERIVELIESIR
ncbi:ParB/RepB/Spo0J family partition protein [Clostridium sp. AN503]|uniref:ParB/RepB/Spo0J family partition protein n=1 Tax=Clostridium sp. AN503 TaxID=3160598 RepID=UPI003458A9C9